MSDLRCPKCDADAMGRGYLSAQRDVLTCAECGARRIDWKKRERWSLRGWLARALGFVSS